MNKVLILLDKSPFTSFGRIAQSYVEALRSQYQVEICYLTSPEYFNPNQELQGFRIHSPRFLLGYYYYKRGLRSVLEQYQPEHLIAIRPELGFLVAQAKRIQPKLKTTVMVHDMFAETLYPDSIKFKLINKFFIDPMLCADGFVYNSRYSLQETLAHYGETKGESVVGCVIHEDQFYPIESPSAKLLLEKHGLDPERKTYLTLCLDEPRKNIQTFFKIAQALPDATFVRVGSQSTWMEEFLDHHQINNVVHFEKLSLEAIRELYNAADALVYTSYLEGFGYPPLEAMACGTQVVSSSTSALGENLEGVAYLVEDPDDVGEYLKGIEALALNPISTDLMMERVRQFSLGAFQQKLIKHLETLERD